MVIIFSEIFNNIPLNEIGIYLRYFQLPYSQCGFTYILSLFRVDHDKVRGVL